MTVGWQHTTTTSSSDNGSGGPPHHTSSDDGSKGAPPPPSVMMAAPAPPYHNSWGRSSGGHHNPHHQHLSSGDSDFHRYVQFLLYFKLADIIQKPIPIVLFMKANGIRFMCGWGQAIGQIGFLIDTITSNCLVDFGKGNRIRAESCQWNMFDRISIICTAWNKQYQF